MKKDQIGRACSTNVGRGMHMIFVGKPEGKRPLGRRRWVDNIKIGLIWTGLNWLRIGTSGELL
jgi:hypothetical protein